MHTTQPPTIRRIAEQISAKPDTLRKRLERAGLPAGLDTPLTEEQVNVLFAVSRADVQKPARAKRDRTNLKSNQDTQNRISASTDCITDKSVDKHLDNEGQKELSLPFVHRFLSSLSDALLVLIVVGHGLLIVQELTQMAGQIGRTAGIMVMLSIVASVSLSSNSRWHGVSGGLIWFVFAIDCAASYLHYRAFEPLVEVGLALGLAITVSAVSFFALYFYREKNSNLFDDY